MTITTTAKRSKKLNIRVGDLKHLIQLQERKLKPGQGVDFDEDYIDVPDGEVWASVKIASSTFPFSETNTDESITHLFYIRYIDGITLDNWILHENKRYKVLAVNDIDFEEKFLELRCNFKGVATEESSKW